MITTYQFNIILCLAMICCLYSTSLLADKKQGEADFKIFDSQPKMIVVNGYSTSFHWPEILQRKLDKQTKGKRVISVKSATKGGTPISKWMDIKTGQPLVPWKERLRPVLKEAKQNKQPVILLAQQSLQWVFGSRSAGIRTKNDVERIQQGVDALSKYTTLLKQDGVDKIFVAMHIYKHNMEPAIQNEQLALNQFLKDKPVNIHQGPNVWQPTKELYPKAFSQDKIHPNSIGAEVIAQKWFETLLQHDEIPIPEWSKKEMEIAIASKPIPDKRKGTKGNQKGRMPRFMKKYDTNGDGKLDDKERKAFKDARKKRRANRKK